MSESTTTMRPYERFGMTEDGFENDVKLHLKFNKSKPRERSSVDLPFYDWEAAAVKRIRERCEGDVDALALLAALMKLVDDDVRRRHAEEALKLVLKPTRANTVGMFFANNVPLSHQSNVAST